MYCDLIEEYRKRIFTTKEELYAFVNENFTKYEGNMLQRWYNKDFSFLRENEYFDKGKFESNIFTFKYRKDRVASTGKIALYIQENYVSDGTANMDLKNALEGYEFKNVKLGEFIEFVLSRIFDYIFDDIRDCCERPEFTKTYWVEQGEKPTKQTILVLDVVEDIVWKYERDKSVDITDVMQVLCNPINKKFVVRHIKDSSVFDHIYVGDEYVSTKGINSKDNRVAIFRDFLNLDKNMPVKLQGKYKGSSDFKAIAEKYGFSASKARDVSLGYLRKYILSIYMDLEKSQEVPVYRNDLFE